MLTIDVDQGYPTAKFDNGVTSHSRPYLSLIGSTLTGLRYPSKELASFPEPVLVLRQVCRWSSRSAVYFGQIRATPNTATVLDVAVKIGRYQHISKEAERYHGLPTLQNSVIPTFHGLYSAGDDVGILEQFGNSLPCSLIELSREKKATVLNLLQDLHKAGMVHGHLEPQNILESEPHSNIMRLVDLEHVQAEHECRPSISADLRFSASDAEKQPWDFSFNRLVCPTVYLAAMNMQFWDDGLVLFRNIRMDPVKVPSVRIMHLFEPVNWSRVYEFNDLKKAYPLWFEYVQTIITQHTLQLEGALDMAYTELDEWDKQHLVQYAPKLGIYDKLPTEGKFGLVKIPHGYRDPFSTGT